MIPLKSIQNIHSNYLKDWRNEYNSANKQVLQRTKNQINAWGLQTLTPNIEGVTPDILMQDVAVINKFIAEIENLIIQSHNLIEDVQDLQITSGDKLRNQKEYINISRVFGIAMYYNAMISVIQNGSLSSANIAQLESAMMQSLPYIDVLIKNMGLVLKILFTSASHIDIGPIRNILLTCQAVYRYMYNQITNRSYKPIDAHTIKEEYVKLIKDDIQKYGAYRPIPSTQNLPNAKIYENPEYLKVVRELEEGGYTLTPTQLSRLQRNYDPSALYYPVYTEESERILNDMRDRQTAAEITEGVLVSIDGQISNNNLVESNETRQDPLIDTTPRRRTPNIRPFPEVDTEEDNDEAIEVTDKMKYNPYTGVPNPDFNKRYRDYKWSDISMFPYDPATGSRNHMYEENTPTEAPASRKQQLPDYFEGTPAEFRDEIEKVYGQQDKKNIDQFIKDYYTKQTKGYKRKNILPNEFPKKIKGGRKKDVKRDVLMMQKPDDALGQYHDDEDNYYNLQF